jgi:hypothetical protein
LTLHCISHCEQVGGAWNQSTRTSKLWSTSFWHVLCNTLAADVESAEFKDSSFRY